MKKLRKQFKLIRHKLYRLSFKIILLKLKLSVIFSVHFINAIINDIKETKNYDIISIIKDKLLDATVAIFLFRFLCEYFCYKQAYKYLLKNKKIPILTLSLVEKFVFPS